MTWTMRYVGSGPVPYVELTVVGALDATELGAAFTAVHDVAEEQGVWLLLSDSVALVRGPGPDPLRAVAVRIGEIGFGSRYRQAILLPSDPAAAAETRDWEAEARAHGLAVRTFTDRAAAVAWLTLDTRDDAGRTGRGRRELVTDPRRWP